MITFGKSEIIKGFNKNNLPITDTKLGMCLKYQANFKKHMNVRKLS